MRWDRKTQGKAFCSVVLWECVLQWPNVTLRKSAHGVLLGTFLPLPVLSRDLTQLSGVIFRNVLQNTF